VLSIPSFRKRQLAIKSCALSQTKVFSSFPVVIGGEKSMLPLQNAPDELCSFREWEDGLALENLSGAKCLLDGSSQTSELISAEEDHALLVDRHLVLFCLTKKTSDWIKRASVDSWCITNLDGTRLKGPLTFSRLIKEGAEFLSSYPSAILNHTYFSTGFYLHSVEFLFPPIPRAVPVSPVASYLTSGPTQPQSQANSINSETGEFTCPACWLRFDRGDAMHIAVHQSLKGDPLLGEDAMLRFFATNFNNIGQALDGMGLPTSDLACPHCRSKLSPGFMDLKQHIVSIVGAPQSGKSYFLSVLTHIAKKSLYKSFQATFHDGDPTGNRLLTAVTNNLFSASTPEQARIAKTGLEGDMYLVIPRMGRKVKMPRPFTFQLTPSDPVKQPVSLVFYDNAGEHFEPGIDAHLSPGAQHISAASGIVYLFDPTYNLAFRRKLTGHADPQLTAEGFDQQDTILAEMNVRVKNLRGIDFREKIQTPLAVVLGKCDVWAHLLGEWKFDDPVSNGELDIAKVKKNSAIVRELLLDLVPAIVANAEIISRNVVYFPSSSFGCSPAMVLDETGRPKLENGRPILGPDPSKLSPILVDVPLLWILSCCEPAIVASTSPSIS
jgi:hypothetical protein